jgi:large subunit ribosomal protein L18e
MKIREKNPPLAEMISQLEERGRLEKVPFWGALAKKLNRPRRKGYEVNMFKLEKNAGKKETIVVPGSVLGTGELSKPLTVAALKFSKSAEEKIRKAGGHTMSLERFIGETKNVKGVRIMG